MAYIWVIIALVIVVGGMYAVWIADNQPTTTYPCMLCEEVYFSSDEAESCEFEHIMEEELDPVSFHNERQLELDLAGKNERI